MKEFIMERKFPASEITIEDVATILFDRKPDFFSESQKKRGSSSVSATGLSFMLIS
jgi:hypothetical protein